MSDNQSDNSGQVGVFRQALAPTASGVTDCDSNRYAYLVENPETARHLFQLLSQGKGDKVAFDHLIDKLMASKSLLMQKQQKSG